MSKQLKKQRKCSGKLPTATTKNIHPPWDDLLSDLSKPITKLYPKREQAILASNVSWHRQAITLWVVKLKWDSPNLTMPRTQKVKAYKPLGEMFRWMLEFCIQCHSLLPKLYGSGWNERYPTAWVWFDLVFNELLSVPDSFSNDDSGTKARQEQAELNDLRKYINPYRCEDNPHSFWLFEAATCMGQDPSSFRRDYYSKFLKAKQAHIADIKKGKWSFVRIDDKGAYYLSGGGIPNGGLSKKRFPLYTFQKWLDN